MLKSLVVIKITQHHGIFIAMDIVIDMTEEFIFWGISLLFFYEQNFSI